MFNVGIMTGFTIYVLQHVNVKNSPRSTRHGVVRGLEIYDGPKIFNCDLYFVIFRGVSQQKSIQHVGGSATKVSFWSWRPDYHQCQSSTTSTVVKSAAGTCFAC